MTTLVTKNPNDPNNYTVTPYKHNKFNNAKVPSNPYTLYASDKP